MATTLSVSATVPTVPTTPPTHPSIPRRELYPLSHSRSVMNEGFAGSTGERAHSCHGAFHSAVIGRTDWAKRGRGGRLRSRGPERASGAFEYRLHGAPAQSGARNRIESRYGIDLPKPYRRDYGGGPTVSTTYRYDFCGDRRPHFMQMMTEDDKTRHGLPPVTLAPLPPSVHPSICGRGQRAQTLEAGVCTALHWTEYRDLRFLPSAE